MDKRSSSRKLPKSNLILTILLSLLTLIQLNLTSKTQPTPSKTQNTPHPSKRLDDDTITRANTSSLPYSDSSPSHENLFPFHRAVFLLLSAGTYPPQEALNKDLITGLSVRVRWEDIEKAPGEYDWNYLDNIMRIAKTHHKYVTLRILGGFWAPDWIYQKGVPSFKIRIKGKGIGVKPFIRKYGETVRLPVVWDETYLTLWTSFIKTVGKRYGSNPNIILVHLSGPTFFSAEPILARDKQELNTLERSGFNERVFITAWEKTIKAFAQSFPQKPLALNIHYIIRDSPSKIYLTLVKMGISLLNHRLVVQGNWLTPKHALWLKHEPGHTPDQEMATLFWQLHKQGIDLGFQEAYPFAKISNIPRKKLKRIERNLIKLLDKLRIRYIEIYPQDLKDEFLKKVWRSYLEKAPRTSE